MAQFKFQSLLNDKEIFFDCKSTTEMIETLVMIAEEWRTSVFAYESFKKIADCAHVHWFKNKPSSVTIDCDIQF